LITSGVALAVSLRQRATSVAPASGTVRIVRFTENLFIVNYREKAFAIPLAFDHCERSIGRLRQSSAEVIQIKVD
jgi:hypothetical protein